MRPILTLLLLCCSARAADENALALALKAQTDFDRVELNAVPPLPDALACTQSQAMVLPVTRATELSLIYYRKAYCELSAATVTRKAGDYREAARDFEKAEEVWPERVRHNLTPPPVSSGLRVLADISHLLADGNTDPRVNRDLESAVNAPECAAMDMPTARCQELIRTGQLWLGWIAAREGRLTDAARWFDSSTELGWRDWVAGRQAIADRRFSAAVGSFNSAERKFSGATKIGLEVALRPPPDLADTEFRLGMAQFEAKDYAAAIRSFDRAVELHPTNARAIYYRGVAKEVSGQSGVADYDLASRTAFANVNAPGASGQAHLYRGVSLYRRKDFSRAEQEFSSALNFDSGTDQQDATAWRHLAAVAGGACGPSATMLEQALDHVSDYFPKLEAEALTKNCPPRSLSEMVKPPTR